MGSLMGAGNAGASAGSSGGGGGQWMRALEESGRVVTQYQQAHNWNMVREKQAHTQQRRRASAAAADEERSGRLFACPL